MAFRLRRVDRSLFRTRVEKRSRGDRQVQEAFKQMQPWCHDARGHGCTRRLPHRGVLRLPDAPVREHLFGYNHSFDHPTFERPYGVAG